MMPQAVRRMMTATRSATMPSACSKPSFTITRLAITPRLTATSLSVWLASATSTSLPRRRPARRSQVVTKMLTARVPSMMAKEAVVTSVGRPRPNRLSMAPLPTV